MRKLKVLILATILLLICGQAAAAPFAKDAITPKAQFDKGYSLYLNGNVTEAMHWYALAAEQGYAPAQFNLGLLYFNFDPPNYPAALELFEIAAEQDFAEAQLILGYIYSEGLAVPQDNAKAMAWYQRAADKGAMEAIIELGLKYFNGNGVEQDYAKAREYFAKATEANNPFAQNMMGYIYYFGYGVDVDYVKAAEYHLLAAEQGYGLAAFNLGNMYHHGLGVEQSDTKAIEFYELAAEDGIISAYHNLAFMYTMRNDEPDYAKAAQWYLRAARESDAAAQNSIGHFYEQGLGIPQDFDKAFEWFSKGAQQENPYAMCGLAGMYEKGRGTERDDDKARELYEKAIAVTEAEMAEVAEMDNRAGAIDVHAKEQILAFAQAYLGKMYEDGRGANKDLLMAVKLYRDAVKNKGAQGQYNLARLYYLSQGVERDYVKAWALLQKALVNEDTYRYYFDFEKEPLIADIQKLLAELEPKMSDDAKAMGEKLLKSQTAEY